MRKLTAVVAALGLLGTASLTPVFAAPADDGAAKTDAAAPAKPKKATASKAKKGTKAKAKTKTKKPEAEKDKSQLGSTDLSGAKKKGKKAKAKKPAEPAKEKSSGLIVYRIAA
jgi:hypothetical protein